MALDLISRPADSGGCVAGGREHPVAELRPPLRCQENPSNDGGLPGQPALNAALVIVAEASSYSCHQPPRNHW